MLHFSQYVIVRQMAGILDMAALGASEAPADSVFNLKGALRPAVRDDDVEYEGMCRCLVEMLGQPMCRRTNSLLRRGQPAPRARSPAQARA